jgi:hypothetical protein
MINNNREEIKNNNYSNNRKEIKNNNKLEINIKKLSFGLPPPTIATSEH